MAAPADAAPAATEPPIRGFAWAGLATAAYAASTNAI